MIVEASGSHISGVVNAPSSKSAMQRFVAGALLAEGITHIFSPSLCDDSMAAIAIATALGARIDITDGVVIVKGGFNPHSDHIFCGESGLSARMFTPIAALHSGEIIINGKGSVLSRPFRMMDSPMAELGVEFSSDNGFLPLKIKGPLKGGDIFADGSVSSQFITGLLMALPMVNDDSLLIADNLMSKPYIDLTISILNKFGIYIINHNYEKFEIAGRQIYTPGEFTVEGDWSGAAFLLVMAAIAGEATIKNLDILSPQADKAILEVLALAGANIKPTGDSVTVSQGNLNCFSFDISDCPDLAPPLTVLALACPGKSMITGTGRLSAKESDRGKILEATLSSLGGNVKNFNTRIEIEGGTRLKGVRLSAGNDHRIAMALSTAALLCSSPVIIDGMECIDKSYPHFIDDYNSLGGIIKLL
jgi:3-phosphoshikimate 1-carboxyvinyltransferase